MARLLSAYGVAKFTFVDNGRVSYSNLARQSLFNNTHFDENGIGFFKVNAAKIELHKISPNLNIDSVVLKVPMPGHFVSQNGEDSVYADLLALEKLILNHDVILNAFDSREARYFPSLISALYNKICFSIGIGYDSFVIVNHGSYDIVEESKKRLEDFKEEYMSSIIGLNKQIYEGKQVEFDEEEKIKISELIKELDVVKLQQNQNKYQFGCFFCSDYIPPNDSMTNRTMDQQCTVSRPGISLIACGIANENLINYLHHSNIGKTAPFIRGSFGYVIELKEYDNQRFESCVACSEKVIANYVLGRKQFLINALNNSSFLNKVTGFEDAMKEFDEGDNNIISIDSFDAKIEEN